MLQRLLNKIKTPPPPHFQQSNNQQHTPHVLPQIDAWWVAPTTIPSIEQVRYGHIPTLPDIWPHILSCNISHFTQLSHSGRRVKEIDLHKQPFPPYLNCIRPFATKEIPALNHILINRYPADRGIMAHTDGPLYAPKVWVLSLGGPAIIAFSPPNQQTIIRLLLEDKSIHIFQQYAYTHCLHSIQDYKLDSIFIKEEAGRILTCSIHNFPSTRYYHTLMPLIQSPNLNQCTQPIQLEDCTLYRIHDNQEYNWKVQIQRKQRISITLRHKYSQ